MTIAGGDTPKANEADENAVRKAINDYAVAMTKGDLKAIFHALDQPRGIHRRVRH